VNLEYISFQPSEVLKPLAILFFIYVLSNMKKISLKQKIIFFIIFSLILLIPIYLQPSLTNVLIIFSSITVVFVNYLKSTKEVIISGLFFLIIALALVLIGNFWGYRKERFISFFTGGKMHQEKYFQVEQSILAASSGGFWGKGLGKSDIKIIGLPEMFTDSIFAIYAEETGFIGSVILIFLFFLLISRIIFLAIKRDDWKRPFCLGVAVWLSLQTFLHISSNIGLFVPTGVVLPLFSYGPSSQLATYFSLGIISRNE
jgi:cell division protein FtsW